MTGVADSGDSTDILWLNLNLNMSVLAITAFHNTERTTHLITTKVENSLPKSNPLAALHSLLDVHAM